MGNSTRGRSPRNPQSAKPHKDYPLTAHPSGRWCKKVRGKLHYFGPIGDPQKALERWLVEKDDLLAGRVPRSRQPNDNRPTLRELVNRFLTTKKMLQDSGELSVHSFRDYYATCRLLIETFGADRLLTDIRVDDFEKLRGAMGKSWGPVRLGNKINEVRVLFNYGYKNELLDKPMVYGEGFRRPSKKTLRKARAAKGSRMFTAEELRLVIQEANQPLKSMFLLAINAALGNEDVGRLPIRAIDLKSGWLDYPRPKTGIVRRVPLWAETIMSIKEWLKMRPAPRDEADAGLLFLTAKGATWSKHTSDNPVSKETRKLLDKLKIKGRGFYSIRHYFETIGGASRDQIAVNSIMGHVDESMAAVYREGIDDNRLQAVSEYVRSWLYSRGKDENEKRPAIAGKVG